MSRTFVLPTALLLGALSGCASQAALVPLAASEVSREAALKRTTLQRELAQEYLDLGDTLLEQEQIKRAMLIFQRAVRLDPTLYHAHHRLGLSYNRLGYDQLEIAEYKKCLSLNPNYLPALEQLGHASLLGGDLDEAARLYTRVLELDARNGRVLSNLARIEQDRGNLAEAERLERELTRLREE